MASKIVAWPELEDSAEIVARRLLGATLKRTYNNGAEAMVKIVETEAYDQQDAASHSYKGKTPRTDVMFGPAGYLYVYFTYGMHYCCNIVTGKEGEGSAVLIRALEPLAGINEIRKNRASVRRDYDVTNGPAKLCKALQINTSMNGHNLNRVPLQLMLQPALNDEEIATTTRIGITKAKDELRRFYIKNNPYVSQK